MRPFYAPDYSKFVETYVSRATISSVLTEKSIKNSTFGEKVIITDQTGSAGAPLSRKVIFILITYGTYGWRVQLWAWIVTSAFFNPSASAVNTIGSGLKLDCT